MSTHRAEYVLTFDMDPATQSGRLRLTGPAYVRDVRGAKQYGPTRSIDPIHPGEYGWIVARELAEAYAKHSGHPLVIRTHNDGTGAPDGS